MGSNALNEALAAFREGQRKNINVVKEAKAAGATKKASKPKQARPRQNISLTSAGQATVETRPSETAEASEAKRTVLHHIGSKLKRLIDCLFEAEAPLTAQELKNRTEIDVLGDKALLEAFTENEKVQCQGEHFVYKAVHELGGSHELLHLLDKTPEGIPLAELKDAYKTILDDIKELQAKGRIWKLQNSDTLEEVVYPSDPRYSVSVDEDVAQKWHETKIDLEPDAFTRELHKAGIKPCLRMAAPQFVKPEMGKKKRKAAELRKYTNVHVAEIFKDNFATGIDKS
ncbi:hypothetical protein CYMTET_40529 [Cymbomonas tetramitiformis]|uniref:Transcription initiation factor IIE subunit beta n=1 Tax=Cymbomonas tetramitiformis TaxID=36881 RepID=A0AAE0F3F6_9CHLO|nr:hypothetical protein CYMTET_40529 [Cymbomonas tetramitiformis]